MAILPGTRLGVYEVTAQIGEGGPPSVAARPFANFGGSMYPRWSAATHQLFWADPAAIWAPRSLLWFNDGNSYYDLHPDGKRVAVASNEGETVQDHVVIMSNFFDYLRTIAPLKP